jgi:hypothetical protein
MPTNVSPVYQFVKGLSQGRPLGVISVTEFGATGDGATDDKAAIQAAVDAALAASKGGEVFLPPGTYAISSPIVVGPQPGTPRYKPLVITGAGLASVLVPTAGTTPDGLLTITGQNPNTDNSGDRYDGRILVRSLSMTGLGLTDASVGIKTHGVQGVHLSELHISAFGTGVKLINTDIVGVSDSYLRLCGTGIQSTTIGSLFQAAGGNANSLTLFRNLIANNVNYGAYLEGGHGIQVIANNFVGQPRGLVVGEAAGYTAVATVPIIRGNYFESHNVTTVQLGGLKGIAREGIVRENVVLEDSGTVWVVANADPFTVIVDNNVSGSGYTAYTDATSVDKPLFDNNWGYSSSRARMLLQGFAQGPPVPAGQTDVVLADGVSVRGRLMPKAGGVLEIGMRLGTTRASGSIFAKVQKSSNSGATWATILRAAGTPAQAAILTGTQFVAPSWPIGTYKFAAGDLLRVVVTTDGAWGPTANTLDVSVTVEA